MIRHLYDENTSFYASKYGLQPGDRIVEPIFQTGFSKHHAIYLGIDAHGTEWISENQKFAGVRLIKASEYFQPGKKYKIQKFTGRYADRVLAVNRALALLGNPYDLILYNCEHYASYVQTGKPESLQVKNGLLFTCSVLLLAILTR